MSNPDRPAMCEWATALAFDLRDQGALPPDEAERLRAHLDECPRCRQDRAWDDRLVELLRDLPPTPPGVATRVRRRLGQRRRLRVTVAVAACLAAVLCWPWWRQPDHRGGSTTPVTSPANGAGDVPGSPVLFAGPPVDPLDVLARQQTAYLAVLEHPEE